MSSEKILRARRFAAYGLAAGAVLGSATTLFVARGFEALLPGFTGRTGMLAGLSLAAALPLAWMIHPGRSAAGGEPTKPSPNP